MKTNIKGEFQNSSTNYGPADHVAATRDLLERMCPTAAIAIKDSTNAVADAQVRAGTQMSPKK